MCGRPRAICIPWRNARPFNWQKWGGGWRIFSPQVLPLTPPTGCPPVLPPAPRGCSSDWGGWGTGLQPCRGSGSCSSSPVPHRGEETHWAWSWGAAGTLKESFRVCSVWIGTSSRMSDLPVNEHLAGILSDFEGMRAQILNYFTAGLKLSVGLQSQPSSFFLAFLFVFICLLSKRPMFGKIKHKKS